ncbi:MAG: hypothetical protein J6W37_11130 [Bacteroidales bacterium]|nr:hypothetical protein [Bacteroidales bacterium]
MNTTKKPNAKRLLIIASSIFFLIASFNLYKANVVTITSDMPEEIKPGATIPVTITINKGSIEGFGRYTNTLPKGFTATSNDANFSFSDNTVTVLWVKLPKSGSFSFTYNIHVPEKSKNSFTFTAKFGYVESNEKKFAEITPKNIRISEDAPEVLMADNETNQKIDYNSITCYRTIGIINNEATISVNINKSNTNTMCKIEEMLPDGYTFSAIDDAGSEISTVANIARFMWKESPKNTNFSVTYKVKANKGYDINDLYINGAFSVFAPDGTKSFIILDKDSRIDESTGYASASENKQIQVSSQENVVDAKTKKELEQQQFTAEQAEFFANASAVNSLKPTKSEINDFQNSLDIPAPTTQSAEKQYELTQKEEKEYEAIQNEAKQETARIEEKQNETANFEKQYEITQTTETTTTKEIVSESKTPTLINNIMSPSSAKPTMTTIDAEPSEITQTTTQTTVTTTTTTIKPVQPTKETEKKVASTTTAAAPVATKTTPAKKSTTTTLSNKNNNSQAKTKVASTNAQNNKVTYRVQVAASHKQLKNTKNFFAKRNINEKVSVEHIDNWYKYTIKSFDQYANARNQRNTVWEQTPIKGAFVVAYNGTKRITVQEALMLTNQKWVK